MASKIYKWLKHIQGVSAEKIYKRYDPIKVYEYNYWIYVCTGFSKFQSTNRWKTNLYKYYQKLIIVVYIVLLACIVTDAFIVRHDLEKLSFNMSSSVLLVTKILQIILMSGLKSDLQGIQEKMGNNLCVETVGESQEDKNILKQKAESILKISLIFYSLLLVGLPVRVVADICLGAKGYLIPVPFRELFESYYKFIYAQQVVVSFHFMTTTLSYDLVSFSFILQFIGHYEIMEKNFQKIKSLYPRRNFEKYVWGYVEPRHPDDREDILIRKANYLQKLLNGKSVKNDLKKWIENEKRREEKTFEMLKESVNHHQKLLAGIKIYFNVYSRPFLIQIGSLVILLGMATVQVLFLSKGVSLLLLQQFLYACLALFNLLCLCSFGSELTSKSISVTHALYDTPWYDMSTSNRNAVSLILQKLSQAPVLRGGNMINIDRATCVRVVEFLQFSYSMVALLRNKI